GEVPSLLRRAHAGDVFDDFASAIDDDMSIARLAAEPLLLRELEPLLSDVVIPRETEDVRQDFATGIITTIFRLVVYPFYLERVDALGKLGSNALLEVREFVGSVEFPVKRSRCQLERLRQRVHLSRRDVHSAWPRYDRLYGRADGERVAKTIDDTSAMRRNLDLAAVSSRSLFLQKIVVDPL